MHSFHQFAQAVVKIIYHEKKERVITHLLALTCTKSGMINTSYMLQRGLIRRNLNSNKTLFMHKNDSSNIYFFYLAVSTSAMS